MHLGILSGFIGGSEIIILVIVAVVLIFGAKKIPELAKTMGRARGEFEKGKAQSEQEIKDLNDSRGKSESGKDGSR